ncbi:VanZ family protein [Butyrivibrio sp. AE3004]|uniref:VanZ family protein n=1 Tax=Butyrivibrio sp. AE3004 TaxID=1506994 RepID=UPI0006913E12|nr:VanZ family protein [Butyrivibrio sp. AE3004]
MIILDILIENTDLIHRIFTDIARVTKYTHVGIAIALIYGVMYLLYVIICKKLKRERKLGAGHATAVFALLIYLTAVLFIVFMSREPGVNTGVNLHLWSSWGNTTLRKALFIENIIMFIPMGILLPGAFKIFRNPIACILTCAVLSCFIENTQYLFKLGIAEIDDVVTNTLGGAIGWIIWGILWVIYLIIYKCFKKNNKINVTKT